MSVEYLYNWGDRYYLSLSVKCLYNWGDRYLYCFVFSGILWSSAGRCRFVAVREYWYYMMMLAFNSEHFFLIVKMHIGI